MAKECDAKVFNDPGERVCDYLFICGLKPTAIKRINLDFMIRYAAGLKPGERVVLRGAYDVQLASAAKGLPAEGHVH